MEWWRACCMQPVKGVSTSASWHFIFFPCPASCFFPHLCTRLHSATRHRPAPNPPACAGAAGGSEAEALQELLRQAGSALPSVQRALALRQAPAPALRPAEGAEAAGAVALAGAVPGLGANGLAPLLSEGPTPQEAPLVGSVPALLALKQWQASFYGEKGERCLR